MKMLLVLITLLLGTAVLAGPARPIRSSNFQMQAPCGPQWDSYAKQGQWFLDPISGTTNVCTWEYHDDATPFSIAGVVQNIQYNPPGSTNGNIVAFDVLVIVSNSLPEAYQGGSASNSHSEVQLPPGIYYQDGLMKEARIIVEFALTDISLQPPPGAAPPYWLDPVSGGTYYIVANNEDERAWYCWTPGNPNFVPPGNFQVPAWRLIPFDIPPGSTSTVLMQFYVTGSGMPVSDYRHSVLRASQQSGLDLLYNRHTSLKISHWLDTLLIDYYGFIGAPPGDYEEKPPEYIYASDCTVFFNTAGGGAKTYLNITPIATNRSPDAIVLNWIASDAVNYHVQYCDNLVSNNWTTITPGMGIPPVIPLPMQWQDDGTIITNRPVQQQRYRFYRLIEP